MSEFKTIKDFQQKGKEEDFVDCDVVSVKQIRAEAIKRVRAKVKYSKFTNNFVIIKPLYHEDWMEFFDISKEELA